MSAAPSNGSGRNRLRERLKARERTLGMWITLESPALAEIAVAMDLDWACIDLEHGHLGWREVIEHLRALRGSGTTALVRVPEVSESAIKRCLDMGAHGVLLPLIRSRAELDAGMRWARYPTAGRRGVGGERAVQWGLGMREYLNIADRECMVIPLIETREAVEAIDQILDAPGLDAIFFGPAALSATYGYLGEWEGPGVAERILDVRRRAEARGIASGVMARSVEDAVLRRDQGFGMVGIASDAGLVIRSLSAALDALRGASKPHLWF